MRRRRPRPPRKQRGTPRRRSPFGTLVLSRTLKDALLHRYLGRKERMLELAMNPTGPVRRRMF